MQSVNTPLIHSSDLFTACRAIACENSEAKGGIVGNVQYFQGCSYSQRTLMFVFPILQRRFQSFPSYIYIYIFFAAMGQSAKSYFSLTLYHTVPTFNDPEERPF